MQSFVFSLKRGVAAVLVVVGVAVANSVPAFAAPGHGTIYIGRPFGWHTSVFALPIEIDGRPLISLGPNQYTKIEVPAGRHTVAVPNTVWARMISGQPHPASVTVQAGQSYYLMPTRTLGKAHWTVTLVGSVAVPEKVAETHSSFSVQSGRKPPAFSTLTYAAPGSH